MHKDIPGNITPDQLEEQVGRLNSDVDEYFDKEVVDIIVHSLRSIDGISVIDSDQSLTTNTISYNSLKPLLIRRWIKNVDFNVSCENGQCKLNNVTDFANIPVQSEQKLISIINMLKKNDTVTTSVDQMRDRRRTIMQNAKSLSDSINREIISKIQNRRYKTKCNGCEKY